MLLALSGYLRGSLETWADGEAVSPPPASPQDSVCALSTGPGLSRGYSGATAITKDVPSAPSAEAVTDVVPYAVPT